MEEKPGVGRARDDIAAGELWRARDRLRGVISNEPAHQPALNLLAEVYHAMGDLPQAGRFWLVTDRDDEDARRAVEAFERAFPRLRDRLRGFPAREPLSAYPGVVQERVAALQAAAAREGIRWEPKGPVTPGARSKEESTGALGEAFAWSLVLLMLGPWLLGLGTIVYLLVNLAS